VFYVKGRMLQQPHGANRSGLWQFECQSVIHASGLFALR